jgi:hypothetical protein
VSDIVERLRAWVYTDSQYATAREAADEIERLREAVRRLADQDATLSVVDGNVIVEMDAPPWTLTDAERGALEQAGNAARRGRMRTLQSSDASRPAGAAWRSAMSDTELRDKFAAAALTGLLSSLPNGDQYHSFAVEKAWSPADAMLRERVRKNTSNDAGPCPDLSQENFRLTDEEREAVEWFAGHSNHGMSMRRAATLRSLLDRTK